MKDKKMEVTWNRTNFKRLGRVRVQIWETIFAIVVPVGLSSYVFGRRCGRHWIGEGEGGAILGACRNSLFVFVSDRSRSGLAENLGQIRFS